MRESGRQSRATRGNVRLSAANIKRSLCVTGIYFVGSGRMWFFFLEIWTLTCKIVDGYFLLCVFGKKSNKFILKFDLMLNFRWISFLKRPVTVYFVWSKLASRWIPHSRIGRGNLVLFTLHFLSTGYLSRHGVLCGCT